MQTTFLILKIKLILPRRKITTMKYLAQSALITILFLCQCCSQNQEEGVKMENINYSQFMGSEISTLHIYVKSMDLSTGRVEVRGSDRAKPEKPFNVNWGDDTVSEGKFPFEHVYVDRTNNYIIKVKSHYSDTSSDSAEAYIRFVLPRLEPIALDSKTTVTVPKSKIDLKSRLPQEGMYKFSQSLSFFSDEFLPQPTRDMIEYVLSTAALIQMDFVNHNVYMEDSTFQQVLLRDAGFGGMYSLWFTDPVSFGVGDYGLQGTIQWSSFFHEMGHNFTLNTPADHYFGGKIDGNANAIYSESMAQIFQHATALSLVNNYDKYGISPDLAYEIKLSAENSFKGLARRYGEYIASGFPYVSWNNPDTPNDETLPTFMTIAYKFFAYAEQGNYDYQQSLKRMLFFLQTFNEEWEEKYDRQHNTKEADEFRATLMVSALSYAFEDDFRADFIKLNFPINNMIYDGLLAAVEK